MEPTECENQLDQLHGLIREDASEACALVDVLARRFTSPAYIQTYVNEDAVKRIKTAPDIAPIILQDTPWGLILTDGFRRLAAAKAAGLKALPAIINPMDGM